MAKKNANAAITVVDQSIQVRSIDRSRKDLAKWRQALTAAESIQSPSRKLLYDLYEDIVLDEHLTSVLDQRRLALTNMPLQFGANGQVNEAVQGLIETEGFEDLLLMILDSKFYGYSLIQSDFTNLINNQPQIKLVPRPHVNPIRSIVVANPSDQVGIDYTLPPYDSLYLGVGKAKDLGLLLKAAPLVLLKRGNVSDWATFNEIFGQPLRIGKYNPNDPTQKAQLEKALENMGSSAWGALPEGTTVELMNTYQSASADTYQRFTNYMNEEISKLIVGQTMTTESGSSLSQSEVHERVGNRVADADRRFALRVLNSRLRAIMAAQGIPFNEDEVFFFPKAQESLSKKDRLEMDLKIHSEVGPLERKYFTEEYNVPFDDKAIKKKEQEQELDDDPDDQEEDDDAPATKKKLPAKVQKQLFQLFHKLLPFFEQAPIR